GGGSSGVKNDRSGHRAPSHAEKKFPFRSYKHVYNLLMDFYRFFLFIHNVVGGKCLYPFFAKCLQGSGKHLPCRLHSYREDC
ncbi:hypothetical protein ACPSTH_005557, partial [Escherichia coli]